MTHIEALEIRYFRSVYRASIKDLRDLSIFSGRNDVGKSNLLKALNLFFNNEVDWKTPFEFSRDFSKVRLNEVRKDTIRGKQFIQLTVHFLRGQRYDKSLPERFAVTRTWTRDAAQPQTRSNLSQLFKRGIVPAKKLDRAEAALQRFLNTIRYQYVPAIKDQAFFSHVLSKLQDVIFDKGNQDSAIAEAVGDLNTSVVNGVNRLKQEFQASTGIPVDIRLPQATGELFRAFAVSTNHGEDQMPIALRGDGIRCRFLPSLLNYISESSNLFHIWGFEEPENSLEHALCTRLAHRMRDEYSKSAQILITSHSPAFFTLSGPRVFVCRISRDSKNNGTVTSDVVSGSSRLTTDLEQELGLLDFQKDFQARYDARITIIEAEKVALDRLTSDISSKTSPIVLTEGKWDVKILEHAWKALNPATPRPFRIASCATNDEDSGEGTGGFETLRAALDSARIDQPPTIGIFDRDKDGFEKGFNKLSKNFKASDSSALKIQKAGTAAAILLPVPEGREDYAEVLNLPMELLFSDTHISKEVTGKRLLLRPRKIHQHVDNLVLPLDVTETTQPHYQQVVKASKRAFVEIVVPTLPIEAFEPFRALFDLVTYALVQLQKARCFVASTTSTT
jgi:hypothetical protein